VHDINLVQQRPEGGKRAEGARLGEAPGVRSGRREYADKIDIGAIDPSDALKV
jgi:hypothetical protein